MRSIGDYGRGANHGVGAPGRDRAGLTAHDSRVLVSRQARDTCHRGHPPAAATPAVSTRSRQPSGRLDSRGLPIRLGLDSSKGACIMNTHQHTPGSKLTVTASLLAVAALAINTWPAMAVARGPNAEGAGTIAAISTSTISMSGTTLIIDGGAANNDIREHYGWPQHIIDTSGVTAGPGCEQVNPTEVYCEDAVNVTYLNVSANLGDGDDKLDAWGCSARR